MMVMVAGGGTSIPGPGGIKTMKVSGGSTGGLLMMGISRHSRVVPGAKVRT